jgi:precorrin-8X/cobalt-precorrin-8 methylmutase
MLKLMDAFDGFVMVDWSASARPKPGKDSIWIAHGHGRGDVQTENPRTRAAARLRVRLLLEDAVRRGDRVLVGFDFPSGYPVGFAERIGRAGWSGTWDELSESITDDDRNRNNRFPVASRLNERMGDGPGPFWGTTEAGASPHLRRTKQPFPCKGLPEFRLVERRLAASQPKSVWQLIGAGCVGSQALLGIPVVRALRHDPQLVGASCVWPFEGFEGQIVHAEIWPRVVHVQPEPGEVPDRAQVRTLVEWASRAELDRLLGQAPIDDEGWILGA